MKDIVIEKEVILKSTSTVFIQYRSNSTEALVTLLILSLRLLLPVKSILHDKEQDKYLLRSDEKIYRFELWSEWSVHLDQRTHNLAPKPESVLLRVIQTIQDQIKERESTEFDEWLRLILGPHTSFWEMLEVLTQRGAISVENRIRIYVLIT